MTKTKVKLTTEEQKEQAKISSITHEKFESVLEDIVSEMSADEILALPGVYEAMADLLNNEVIERCLEEMED